MTDTSPLHSASDPPARRFRARGLRRRARLQQLRRLASTSTRTAAVLEAALDAGITLFDTADIYGGAGASERLMGEALEGRETSSSSRPSSAGRWSGVDGVPDAARGSREYIRWAIEGSLRRLRVDRIDLYQYHRPDGVTPIAETLAALDEFVGEGIVGAIGCSNFSAAELEEAERVARRPRPGPLRHPAERVQPARARARGATSPRPASASTSRSCPSSRSPRACSAASTGAVSRRPQGTPARRCGRPAATEQFDVVEALEAFAGRARHRPRSTSRSPASPPSPRSPR